LVPLTVEVSFEGAETPAECVVRVDGEPTAITEHAWTIRTWGQVTASAWCDGRPATPVVVDVQAPTTVVVEWSAVGPLLDITGRWPGVERVFLSRPGDWSLEIGVDQRGMVPLPPLSAGSYVMSSERSVALVVPNVEPGVATFTVNDEAGTWVGFLTIKTDLVAGQIPVEIVEPSP